MCNKTSTGNIRYHISYILLNHLESPDRSIKLFPLFGIVQGHFLYFLENADSIQTFYNCCPLDYPLDNRPTVTDAAKDIIPGDFDIIKGYFTQFVTINGL